ncbi:MAG TPA: MFS transporter [Actinomycetota bacterium]|nr:MFS transporter [Actinomycetota bacterium]
MGGPRPTLRENLRALPPAAWVLFAGTFVNRLGTFVLPFITLYLTSRDFSVPQAGLAVAMYGIGGFGAQVVGGLLTDRIGRRNAIGFSMLGAAALTLVLWQATTLVVIYPVMAVLAFVAELHRPAAQALITDMVPSEGRVSAFATYRLAINIGWACGLALGGLLADRSFGYLFVGDAATSAAFGVISLVALPHGTRTSRHEERHLSGATRTILADRGFLLFLGSILIGGSIYMQNVSTFALHVRDAGYSNAVYGALQALNGAIVVFLELPIAAWTGRRSRTHMVALGGVLIGAAFASLTVATAIWTMVAMVFVWTLGEIVSSPPASAFVADRSPEHTRGRYQAALGMMFALGGVIGPVIGTVVYARSPNALWIGCGVAGLVSGALALAAGRYPAPALPARPAERVDAPGT